MSESEHPTGHTFNMILFVILTMIFISVYSNDRDQLRNGTSTHEIITGDLNCGLNAISPETVRVPLFSPSWISMQGYFNFRLYNEIDKINSDNVSAFQSYKAIHEKHLCLKLYPFTVNITILSSLTRMTFLN